LLRDYKVLRLAKHYAGTHETFIKVVTLTIVWKSTIKTRLERHPRAKRGDGVPANESQDDL
jgi:hypothetical protein